MLADIVSKNGNLLLNVVLYPDGSLPPESQNSTVRACAVDEASMPRRSMGRVPWTVYGEGPTETAGGAFKESAEYTARDIRFTTKGGALYAITLGEPSGRVDNHLAGPQCRP